MNETILAPGFSEQPWWWNQVAPSSQAEIPAQGETDVIVIGSGYAGLSCAHELASGGLAVTVIDAGKIGSGASTRNAGFLSGRAGVSKQINLEALVGKAHANRIFAEADSAYAYLRRLIESEGIDCNLEAAGRFIGAHTPAAFDKLAAKMREYNSDGQERFHMVSRAQQREYVASDYWYGGMYTEEAGSIHPSRYHRGLVDLCLRAGVKLISDNRVLGIVDEAGRKHVHSERGGL
jgi:glycine/D-amino acid oxidase-like deaminating enzyme